MARADIAASTDPATEPLCAPGGHGATIDCRIEQGDFTTGTATPTSRLVVVAYNVERGLRLDDQLDAFTRCDDIPRPDVLLLSEADRGCSRSGGVNVARRYAEALGMTYAYGVEFVELPRRWGGGGTIERACEHGNAIVSRFPLEDVLLIRHSVTRSWSGALQRHLRVGQPRLGGRIAIAADVVTGSGSLRLYVVHLESGRIRIGRWNRDRYRVAQVREVVSDAATADGAVLIGGDMNTIGYLRSLTDRRHGEPVTTVLSAAGFHDGHTAISPAERITSDSGAVLDLVVGRSVDFTDAGIGTRAVWGDLSDHLPVWVTVELAPVRRRPPDA